MPITRIYAPLHWRIRLNLHRQPLLLHVCLSYIHQVYGIRSIKVFGDFLHRYVFRLNEERPDDPALNPEEDATHDGISPGNFLKGDRVDVLIEEQEAGDTGAKLIGTVGAKDVGENFV